VGIGGNWKKFSRKASDIFGTATFSIPHLDIVYLILSFMTRTVKFYFCNDQYSSFPDRMLTIMALAVWPHFN
jgi:hypothetical protein